MQQRSEPGASGDPFAMTPDPHFYVPRAATEAARRDLLRSACNPAKTSALLGPPGLGKTLLLHLLAREVPEHLFSVYLPYAALPPEDLCAWALGLLGRPAAADPVGSLRTYSQSLHEQGSALLMLIDDAASMPIATARGVGDLLQDSGGGVRLTIAASDSASGNRAIAAIGSNFDIVHLDEPMTESETSHYIDGRLALARVPDSIRARFDTQTVRLLHRISAGIPRRLHSAATAILQEPPVATTDDPAMLAASAAEAVEGFVAARDAEPAPEPTVTAPHFERRVARRRAEPEGVSVRVGSAGEPAARGRRAEDRGEAPLGSSESAAAPSRESERWEAATPDESQWVDAQDSREPAAFEVDEADDREIAADREPSAAPSISRAAPAASRRSIALGTLFVAFAAVAIPVIRSVLSEPPTSAGLDQRAESAQAPRAVSRRSAPEDSQGSLQGEPGAAGASASRGDLGAPNEAAASPVATREKPAAESEPAAAAPARAEPVGSFAVQINASPWANVEVDGIDLGATPLANIPLLGGPHAFRVRMPDGRVIERTIEIDAENRFLGFE